MKHTLIIALSLLALSLNSVQAHDEDGDSMDSKQGLMKADANNDGKVSFEEFKAAHEKRLKQRFEHKDINNDGFIDLEEKKVAKQKRREKITAEKEAMRQSIREELSEERKRRKRHFYKY